VIIGNIRMGFGHYRISMALASAAYSLGYEPVWLDLNSCRTAPAARSSATRTTSIPWAPAGRREYPLFNKLVWDPLNSEGFRKLSYNVSDEKVTELMAPVYRDIPRDTRSSRHMSGRPRRPSTPA
jgi:hypothetical protein